MLHLKKQGSERIGRSRPAAAPDRGVPLVRGSNTLFLLLPFTHFALHSPHWWLCGCPPALSSILACQAFGWSR